MKYFIMSTSSKFLASEIATPGFYFFWVIDWEYWLSTFWEDWAEIF